MRAYSINDLRAGDIGFGPIDGRAGLIVAFGQLMLKERVRIHKRKIDHVFVITQEAFSKAHPSNVGPLAVEAMPKGAREIDISDRWTDRYIYLRLPYENMQWQHDFARGQNEAGIWTWAERVAQEARRMIGTPYSFLDYGALALRHWGMPHDALRNYITSSGHMICPQLADQALTRAGIQVFNDGRLSQDVTPGALYYQLIRMGAMSLWPE